MKLAKPSPHRARNDFDLSHRHVMSMNFGEIIPVTTIETVPGDFIEMSAADLIRAIPLVTSPFLRAKQHLDVWFVPYHDLWHNFENFMIKKSQPVSSALRDWTYLPWVNLYDLWDTTQASTDKDIVGRDLKDGAARLLNYLGYGYAKLGTQGTQVSVNPFRLAAYQYIWYNEYRQQYYDDGMNASNGNVPNASYMFNFDSKQCNTLANAQITTLNPEVINMMCQLRYRTWKKDLYTGLMPSTQFGNVSTVSGTLTDLVRLQSSNNASGSLSSNSQGYFIHTDGGGNASNQWKLTSGNYTEITTDVDILALRKSEAIQIWRENSLRAGNRVKDNMLAHYGVDSDFRDHRPTYLGSVDSPLNIGDVMTTANSTTGVNDTVGDVAGKGLSSLDEKVFKFNAKDFGVIMVMASILPEAEYNAEGVSRMNQLLEAEDFFVPEYENLGLEAVSSQNFKNTATTAAKVIGYAPRYFGYKTKLDKCYDLFKTGGINSPWCSPKYDVSTALGTPPAVLPLSTLYVNPKIFDVNFSVGVDVQPQFLCDFYFDVDAVRPMSVVGLPFS